MISYEKIFNSNVYDACRFLEKMPAQISNRNIYTFYRMARWRFVHYISPKLTKPLISPKIEQ